MRAAIILAFAFAAACLGQTPPVPLYNTYLQTPMDGKGQSITNLGAIYSSNYLDAATGFPFTGGGGISDVQATNIAAYQAYLATNGLPVGSGSQTPILQDVDFGGFSATNVGFVEVSATSGAALSINSGAISLGANGSATFANSALGIDTDGTITVSTGTLLHPDGSSSFAGGAVIIDAAGNTTFAGGIGLDTGGNFTLGGGSATVHINADGSASFASGNCTIDATTGKVTATGVIDPPVVLIDQCSQAQVLQIIANQVPSNKLTGLNLWFNGTNLMAYQASTKQMYRVPMELVGTVELPAPQARTNRVRMPMFEQRFVTNHLPVGTNHVMQVRTNRVIVGYRTNIVVTPR